MKIQTKIALLLSTITILFISGLLYINHQETKREEFFLKNKIHEKNTLFDKVLRLEGATLEMFAFDFSNSDKLINIIKSGEKRRFNQYFEGSLRSFNVNAVWIYSKEFKLLHTLTNIEQYIPPDINEGDDFAYKIASRGFYHYFMETPAGLMEIRCSPVQPSADMERNFSPEGYLFAGRLWSERFLAEISTLTESTINILPITEAKTIDAKYDPIKGIIGFSRVVQSWDAKPLNILYVESLTPFTRELHRTSSNQLILIILFVMFIVVLLSALLIVWVNMPLKKISKSLDNENPDVLFNLRESKSEFGKLAQLITKFFHQKQELTNEVNERLKAELALKDALAESRQREAETSALFKASRAVLEYQEFREASQRILNSCKNASRAKIGFIAEKHNNSLRIITACDEATLLIEDKYIDKTPINKPCIHAFKKLKPVFYNTAFEEIPPFKENTISNILCAPLIIKDSADAVLCLANKQDNFTDNDIKMAQAFTELASVALLNSRTLQSLENSEERFRSVVQTASDAIISVDKYNNIVFWNRASEILFGYTFDEAIGKTAGVLLPERFALLYQKRVNQIKAEGNSGFDRIPVELVGLRKDGSEFPMEFSQSTWKTAEGIFYTAIIRDITQRKNAEENIIKSEKRFRDIVENSLSGILIIRKGVVVYHNGELARILGNVPKQFDSSNVMNIHPDDRKKFQKFIGDLLSGDSPAIDIDFRFYPLTQNGVSGSVKWINCRGTLIDYQGQESVFLNIMDITRIMELEQLLRIQDKMASLGRVAAGIAHEIRNPLTGINSYIYAIKKHSATVDSQSGSVSLEPYISGIQSASNKIEAVIRRVMDFSRPTNPKLCLVDINKSIEDALLLSSTTLKKNNVNIKKSLSPELPPCHADSHMIEQVILNLLTNAVQAMSKLAGEKNIEIKSDSNSKKITITVSDSGPGIPEEQRFKIFDPFYTTKTDGMGIGLGMCHRIITDHRGNLTVSKSRFGGAEFCVELPAGR